MAADPDSLPALIAQVEGLQAQVDKLIDRQKISALLYEFGYLLDTKQFRTQAELYADGAVLDLAFAGVKITKDQLIAADGAALRGYRLTQHFSTNHRIEIDGDTAHTISYMLAIHMYEDQFKHADVGGYYDCELVRVGDDWKFMHVVVNANWAAGEPMQLH